LSNIIDELGENKDTRASSTAELVNSEEVTRNKQHTEQRKKENSCGARLTISDVNAQVLSASCSNRLFC